MVQLAHIPQECNHVVDIACPRGVGQAGLQVVKLLRHDQTLERGSVSKNPYPNGGDHKNLTSTVLVLPVMKN